MIATTALPLSPAHLPPRTPSQTDATTTVVGFSRYMRQLRFGFESEFDVSLTQADIARFLEVGPSTVNKWFAGSRTGTNVQSAVPNVLNCYALAHLFKRPIEEPVAYAGHPLQTFVGFVEAVSRSDETWRSQKRVTDWLLALLTEPWTWSQSGFVIQAHQLINHPNLPLRERATMVAHSVSAWLADPDRELPIEEKRQDFLVQLRDLGHLAAS